MDCVIEKRKKFSFFQLEDITNRVDLGGYASLDHRIEMFLFWEFSEN